MAIKKLCPKCGKVLIDKSDKYCDKCQSIVDKADRDRYRDYNRNRIENDREYVKFYNSIQWIRLRDSVKARYFGLCIPCLYKAMVDNILPIYKGEDTGCCEYVHHIVEVKDCWEDRLNRDNLICVCSSCHKQIHDRYDKSKDSKIKCQNELQMMIRWFWGFFGLR